MLKISVIGAGYVGLVSGACLAKLGYQVICLDTDSEKIQTLNMGIIPIYEPGLKKVVSDARQAGRLSFVDDYAVALEDSDVIFIAVGTPSDEDGSADLRYVIQAAASIGKYLKKYTVIVDKSTVPVGTGKLVKETIASVLAQSGRDVEFDVVSNPEFLREGSAVEDFMNPDRIIIGFEGERAGEVMSRVYKPLCDSGKNLIFCDVETSELIKYATNAYLATRITFVNELALLCEEVGADVEKVSAAMGSDSRIGNKYLQAGPGYGGSCFPKDTRALVSVGRDYGVNMSLVETVITANENQKRHMVKRIVQKLGNVKGKKVAVLGLAFKPNTDDVRESPAAAVVKELSYRGAFVTVYDPVAMENSRRQLFSGLDLRYADDALSAVEGVDGVVVATEWDEFRDLNMLEVLRAMKGNALFDLRNIYNRRDMETAGFSYYGVGR